MQKQHKRHFEICAQIAALGDKAYAVRYLEGMIASAMSKRALAEIKAEIAKYR